ncbi:hypothetical protein KEM55_008570 [Ascosphaera atra]|nr:hypothetical protein KEM55_008570 [Ascosphaera atra]
MNGEVHEPIDKEVQARINAYEKKSVDDDTVEFLKTFFDLLPSDGKEILKKDVLDCRNSEMLWQLADFITRCILYPFKAKGHKLVLEEVRGSVVSREGLFDAQEEGNLESATRHRQQALKDDVLRRDGYQCIVTGVVAKGTEGASGRHGNLVAAHIIPLSTAKFGSLEKRTSISAVWGALTHFFPQLGKQFGPENINSASNVLTLFEPIYKEFDAFNFCLEPDEEDSSTYHIKTFPGFSDALDVHLPRTGITKIVSNDDNIAPPSRLLLRIHAIVANVLNATGRGERIEQQLRKDKENEEKRCYEALKDAANAAVDDNQIAAARELPLVWGDKKKVNEILSRGKPGTQPPQE